MKYSELSAAYEKLEKTPKRLEKTHIVAELLKKTKEDDLAEIILLLQGRVFPLWDETNLGVSDRLVIKAISLVSGKPAERVEEEWKKLGDLGLVAAKLVEKKSQATLFTRELTTDKVFKSIKGLASLEGVGSVDMKIKIMSELLSNAKPQEATYLVRTFLEDLRVGVGIGSLRDALVWTYLYPDVNYDKDARTISPTDRSEYSKACDALQRAFDLKADFAELALAISKKGFKGIEKIELEPGSPVNVMLYQKAKSLTEAFERVGKPCALEFKYDGFRMLMHKKGNELRIFTRRLEDVTTQFPEAVRYISECVHAHEYIIDGEAVGMDPKTGKYMPFQQISQRIRRKYDIERLAKELPVEINVFDALLIDGKTLLDVPFIERRKALEKVVKPKKGMLVLAHQLITDDLKKAEVFYKQALAAGQEGIMAKNLQGLYQPGSRVGFGVKVKPVMETLDLAIVGAEWGTGKRSGWLTSFVLACRDGQDFVEIGKVGTGLKELEEEGLSFEELTSKLKPYIASEHGKMVKIRPKIVVEIKYEEIQKSPTYSSGFALRFPRFVRLREDKGASEASELSYVEELYGQQ